MTATTTDSHYRTAPFGSDDVKLDLAVAHSGLDPGEVRRGVLEPVIEDLARPGEGGLVAGAIKLADGLVGLKPAAEVGAGAGDGVDVPAVVDDDRVHRAGGNRMGVDVGEIDQERARPPLGGIRHE